MLKKALAGLAAVCLLTSLAACKDGALTPQGATFVNGAITAGQLYCSPAGQVASAGVIAVINAADKSAVTVTDKTAAVVAALCPVVNGVKYLPVVPPPNPAAVPAVPVTVPTS